MIYALIVQQQVAFTCATVAVRESLIGSSCASIAEPIIASEISYAPCASCMSKPIVSSSRMTAPTALLAILSVSTRGAASVVAPKPSSVMNVRNVSWNAASRVTERVVSSRSARSNL